jgi:hypothetical protein
MRKGIRDRESASHLQIETSRCMNGRFAWGLYDVMSYSIFLHMTVVYLDLCILLKAS